MNWRTRPASPKATAPRRVSSAWSRRSFAIAGNEPAASLGVGGEGGVIERREAAEVGFARIGAAVEQPGDDLFIGLASGEVKGRAAVAIARVDQAGIGFEESDGRRVVAADYGRGNDVLRRRDRRVGQLSSRLRRTSSSSMMATMSRYSRSLAMAIGAR